MLDQIEVKVEENKRIKIFDESEIIAQGRTTAEVGPHQAIIMEPSPEGRVRLPGSKCEHGGYIPSTHPDPDRAPYCSVCYPYLIKEKE